VSNAEFCTAEQSIFQLHEFESIFDESILPQLAKYAIKIFSAIFTIAILILSYYNKLFSHKTGFPSEFQARLFALSSLVASIHHAFLFF
jgi:hypothetical protein